MKKRRIVLGAGITGLACGFGGDAVVYEEKPFPGGICMPYYTGADKRVSYSRDDEETYRFKIGGGRWISGADAQTLSFMERLSPLKSYTRRASVYFPDMNLYVPYPVQNHLSYLPGDIRNKIVDEIKAAAAAKTPTFADYLMVNFGKTFCEIFFFPFHELYTAGVYTTSAPQDEFKSPADKEIMLRGAREQTPQSGYNLSFVYPRAGLDDLIRKIAAGCTVEYNKKAVRINLEAREIVFADGSSVGYDMLVSTLPLDRMAEMAGIADMGRPAPYTSLAVFNIGAARGPKCPHDHWVYIPRSWAGFHRIGFYSNADESFLPASSQGKDNKVGIYVERAFRSGKKPSDEDLPRIGQAIVRELRDWGYIGDADVISPAWINCAYTWQQSNSSWRDQAVERLQRYGVYQAGRYGTWRSRGISGCLRDGFRFQREFRGEIQYV